MVIRPMPNATAFTRPPAAFPMNLDVLPASCRQDAGSTLAGSLSVRRRSLGLLTTDLVIAMAILALAMIPLSYAVVRERQLSRALYYRALATEIVDCEVEVLRAGEWHAFGEGSHPFATRAESATNLPPGKFVLTRGANRLRLEWMPEKRGKGARVAREVTLP